MLRLASVMCIALVAAVPAWGDPIILVGEHILLPDTPGQSIEVYVSGTPAVQGLNLNVQLGPDPYATDGPVLSGLDILTDTIFAANNTGASNPEQGLGIDLPMFETRTTTTLSGTVVADGLLATMTVDTSGLQSGTWTLSLSNTLNGPTDFAGLSAIITDGSIHIVPEPATLLLALTALVGFIAFRRRSRLHPLHRI